MRIILGSNSKWRAELAKKQFEFNFEIRPAGINEKKIASQLKFNSPEEYTSNLAQSKLDHLSSVILSEKQDESPVIIICCDTIVLHENRILDKPKKNDCKNMIKLWCKKDCKTEVLTAVAVGLIEGQSNSPRKVTLNQVEKADFVMLKDMNDNEIDEYIKNSGCNGSSGAVIAEYLLEKGFAKINGDLTIFQGLPISCINRMIDEIKNM